MTTGSKNERNEGGLGDEENINRIELHNTDPYPL